MILCLWFSLLLLHSSNSHCQLCCNAVSPLISTSWLFVFQFHIRRVFRSAYGLLMNRWVRAQWPGIESIGHLYSTHTPEGFCSDDVLVRNTLGHLHDKMCVQVRPRPLWQVVGEITLQRTLVVADTCIGERSTCAPETHTNVGHKQAQRFVGR